MTQTVPHAAVRQREVSVIRPVSGEVGTLQKRIPWVRHLRPLVASDITVLIMSNVNRRRLHLLFVSGAGGRKGKRGRALHSDGDNLTPRDGSHDGGAVRCTVERRSK